MEPRTNTQNEHKVLTLNDGVARTELGPNVPTESDTSNRELEAMDDGVSISIKHVT